VLVIHGCGSVLLWRHNDMLHISSFIDDVVFAHKLRLLDVATRLRQWDSHAALGLARRNTHCRYWTLGTSSWPVLKVTPQVATPGAECAVCDCLVWMAVHHFQPVTSSQYYHISSWLPISFQSSYLANLTQSGHPAVIIHHSPLFYCWLQKHLPPSPWTAFTGWHYTEPSQISCS